jgi:hypothetical protein
VGSMITDRALPPRTTRAAVPAACALFAALSCADLLLTAWLLQQHETAVYEANPLARWLLRAVGWPGVVALKLAVVLLASALAVGLCRRHPRLALRVLSCGCGITAAVVLYSGWLALALEGDAGLPPPPEERALEAVGRCLDLRISTQREYQAVHDSVTADLVAGRCRLHEAVQRLETAARGCGPGWHWALRHFFPAATEQESLALRVVVSATETVAGDAVAAARLNARLADEFRTVYGRALPETSQRVAAGAGPARGRREEPAASAFRGNQGRGRPSTAGISGAGTAG